MRVFFVLGLCICSVAFAIASIPIVHSNFGAIRGKWTKSTRGLSIASYLGIPYAEQPIGPLRFKNPEPWTRNWDGILDASEDGPACPQPEKDMIIGREDCLHLNIFVPQIKNERKLPILVFVHGGAFSSGSNNSTEYSPAYLLDHEIILVTVNYRLGIFGFLSTGNEASPGNYGIKDVFEALKWLQVNIGQFGGDPTSVTISGASAGAEITHYLALSKHTEGFFDKIITHSGSATAPTFIHSAEFSRIKFIKLAILMGCTTEQKIIDFQSSLNHQHNYQDSLEDDEVILDCLREANPIEITQKLGDFKVIQGKYPSMNFIPTIEAELEGAIVTRHPQSIIEKGEFRDIPWISGVTLDEGLIYTTSLFTNPESLVDLKNDLEEALPSLIEMQEIVMNNSYYANQLMDFYFPNGFNVNENISEANLTAMVGDGLFTYWIYSSLDQQARLMNSSVYFYQFSYKGTFSETFSHDSSQYYGICHGDDLNYLFPRLNNQYDYLQLNNTLDDITMVNIMTEFWSSFVKTGIPRAILTADWEPYQEDFRFMRLGMAESPDISMEKNFLSIRMDFWRNLMGNISVPREQLFFEENDDESTSEKNQTISLYSEFSISNFISYFIISSFFNFYLSKYL